MQNSVFLACGRCEMINKSVGEELKKKNLHRDTDSLSVFLTIQILEESWPPVLDMWSP